MNTAELAPHQLPKAIVNSLCAEFFALVFALGGDLFEKAQPVNSHDLLKDAYAAFNRRDIDAALAAMHSEVEWANGMEGGSLHGPLAVREYWSRQWGLIDPRVEPVSFEEDETGRVLV